MADAKHTDQTAYSKDRLMFAIACERQGVALTGPLDREAVDMYRLAAALGPERKRALLDRLSEQEGAA